VTSGWLSKRNQLDEFVQQLYGCSFDESLDKFFQRAYDRGLVADYKIGRTDGRRAAKGLKTESKKRGRPTKMSNGLNSLLVDEVNKARAVGKTTTQGVERFFATMRKARVTRSSVSR
jgi:hypothetical protein